MSNLIPLTNDNRVSARELYNFLELAEGQFSRWAKTNIIENEFAVENEDYIGFDIVVEGNQTKDYLLTTAFAKKLCMVSKSQRGEQARNYFIAVEERLKAMSKPVTVLDALSQTVQVLQEQEQRIKQLEGTTQAIKETIIQEPDNWREDINHMFNKIVDRIGGQKFQEIRNESYKLLESRAHVDLQRRLMNLRTRMLDQGFTKTAIEKANRMDVIEQDPKLREIYSQIIKEYYIKFVA
ncbi:MAG: antA/AntB antirepressor family protein [Caulobacteraceae bacterium]